MNPHDPAGPLDHVRQHFPALERTHHGRPVAYFDGPGGTQVPRAVGQAMLDYLYHHNANTHWAFPTSAETDEALARSREALADFLQATPAEIAFGANMTTLTFHVSRALGHRLGPGDEIVVTELDHHANIDPWLTLARERGLTIRNVLMIPETGQLDWDDFALKVTEHTRIVALGAASNALGTINDIPRAAALAHSHGALLYVDAVHYAPHRLIDVSAWDCDFLACSAYKFHGPHVGVLYGRRHLIEGLETPKLAPAPNASPERLETGTQNHEGIVGAAAAVDFLASLAPGGSRRERLDVAYDALEEREMALFSRFWDGLNSLPHVRTFGPDPSVPRTPTAAFVVEGQPPADVAARLADEALFVSHGDFYATSAVDRLGLAPDGLVRVGLACYNTDDEVDRLLDALGRLASS